MGGLGLLLWGSLEPYGVFMNSAALRLLLKAVLQVFHCAFQSSYKT